MIRLHGLNTPNTHKITICLEELALPYEILSVDVRSGAHLDADFEKLNPTGKIPVIVDTDSNTTVFESCAILLYLASKADRLMPHTPNERWEAIQWLFFQAASVGPMLGQRAWFTYYAGEEIPYAISRYDAEAKRLYAVLDRRLQQRSFICGTYSIMDIAHFGWLHCAHAMHLGFEEFPALTQWYRRVLERPAVQRGIVLPTPLPEWNAEKKLGTAETQHA
jgi:GST-like protein